MGLEIKTKFQEHSLGSTEEQLKEISIKGNFGLPTKVKGCMSLEIFKEKIHGNLLRLS